MGSGAVKALSAKCMEEEMLDIKGKDESAPAAHRNKSAALTVETDLDGLEGVKLLSPAKSPSGIAFELTDHFKTPRAGAQSKARERLEGYLSTPVKAGRPRSPAEDPLPRLLSRGRAAKLHIDNEAKKLTAERAGTKQAERLRRLSDGLNEKASHALEKRKEVLAGNVQKAKKHNEAVEDKLKRFQEAEEHRREELKAKLEPSNALEKRKEVVAGSVQKAKKHNEAVEDKLKRLQEAEEHRREELKAKLEPSNALEKRKEVLAGNIQKAKKHNEAVEDKLKRLQEAEEHRREELKAKLERKMGSKVSGRVSDGPEPLDGHEAGKFEPPARARGGAAAAPRRPTGPERQPGSFLTGAAGAGGQERLASTALAAVEGFSRYFTEAWSLHRRWSNPPESTVKIEVA